MKKFQVIFAIVLVFSFLSYGYSGVDVKKLDLKGFIESQAAKGVKKIIIPKGVYELPLIDSVPITLKNIKNVEIIGNGSEVICKTYSQILQLTNCENVKISGLSFDFDPLPFSQGKIIDIDKGKRMWWIVELFKGYTQKQLMCDRIQIFDPHTLNLKKNGFTYWENEFEKIEKIGDRKIKIYKSRYSPKDFEELNDLVVLTAGTMHSAHDIYSIVIKKSKNITLSEVTVYSSTCFSFFEEECENNHYFKCRVTKKLNDPKLSFPRLRSGYADAFHSKSAYKGPTVEQCEFRYMGDDGIAINSRFYLVNSGSNNQVDLVVGSPKTMIEEGNMVRFVSFQGVIKKDAKIIKIEQVSNSKPEEVAKIVQMYNLRSPRGLRVVLKLTLDRPVEVEAGDLVSSLSKSGSGFIVRNNIVGFTRARGILIKASNGVISGNSVEGCELGGIIVAPELYWMEAGFSENLKIWNNKIKDCLFTVSNPGNSQASALSIVAENGEKKLAPAGAFKNISVLNNKIQGCPWPAVFIASLENGELKNNTITKSTTIIREHGKALGLSNQKPIWTDNIKNVTISNNKILGQ